MSHIGRIVMRSSGNAAIGEISISMNMETLKEKKNFSIHLNNLTMKSRRQAGDFAFNSSWRTFLFLNLFKNK